MFNLQAGNYVTDAVINALVVVISNAIDLQGYTVRTLFRSFQDWKGQVRTVKSHDSKFSSMFGILILLPWILMNTNRKVLHKSQFGA